MKKSISIAILIICIVFVMQFERIMSLATRLVDENYKKSDSIYFNLNNDFENRAQVYALKDAYIIVGRTKLQYISEKGILIWEKDITSQNVSVDTESKLMLLAEKKAGDLFLVNESGEITQKRFAIGNIESIRCFSGGYFGVLKSNHEFILLDKSLKTVSSTELPSGTIIDYKMNLERQNVAFLLLDLKHAEFNTKLIITTFNGNIVSGSNISEDIGYAMRLKKDKIVVLVDHAMMSFDYDGKKLSEATFDQTISQFKLADSVFLYLNNANNTSVTVETPSEQLVVYDDNGNILNSFKPPFLDIMGVNVMDGKILLYNSNKVVLTDFSGKVQETYDVIEDIVNVHVMNNKGFAIEYMDHLDVYTLR
ncbi:MAG: hypothetical protein BGO41_09530 [Clostridiales bacterium 38-18]|nr:MAG: hypothetical protein BGO41_09530 [Clostridiales bacterium 38-18]